MVTVPLNVKLVRLCIFKNYFWTLWTSKVKGNQVNGALVPDYCTFRKRFHRPQYLPKKPQNHTLDLPVGVRQRSILVRSRLVRFLELSGPYDLWDTDPCQAQNSDHADLPTWYRILTIVYLTWISGSGLRPHQQPHLGTMLFVSNQASFLPLRT